VRVTNEMVIELVRDLRSTSEVPPIIVLQADEGPYPERYLAGDRTFRWAQATDAELKEKMGILNAYYLPEWTTTTLGCIINNAGEFLQNGP